MKQIKFRRKSILARLLFPMSTLMLLQTTLIIATIVMGSTFQNLNNSSLGDFLNRVELRRANVESTMISDIENNTGSFKSISKDLTAYLGASQLSIQQAMASHENRIAMIETVSTNLFQIIRACKINYVYLILDTPDVHKEGVCLYDRNPEINSYDNGDLIIEIAPLAVKKQYMTEGLDTSSRYETAFDFSEGIPECYTKALIAGQENPRADISSLSYWSDSFRIHGADTITYQLPLVVDGQTIGVVGVGMDKPHFVDKLLTNSGNVRNIGVVRRSQAPTDFSPVVLNLRDSTLRRQQLTRFEKTDYRNVYEITMDDGQKYHCALSPLPMYADSAYYSAETWYMVGLIDNSELFASNQEALSQVIRVLVFCLSLGLATLVLTAIYITKPILNTAAAVSKGSGRDIPETHVYELDLLVDELKRYVEKSLELPGRLNRLLDLANVDLAAFEYNEERGRISVTDKFFSMLSIPVQEYDLSLVQMQHILDTIPREHAFTEHGDEVFFLASTNRWLKIRLLNQHFPSSGVLLDVTTEIQDRRQVEHERDYDILTGLLNRRGFMRRIERCWSAPGESLMLMMDLDNLKLINDKYGHDFGDDYICLVASEIRTLNSPNVLTCHVSGDEFLIYAHGFASQQQIRDLMADFNKRIRLIYMDILGEKFYARMSCGMAFRSPECRDVEELQRWAEFSMHEVKNSGKNRSGYFDPERFAASEQQLRLVAKFNTMLARQDIQYAFQAIVDIRTGKIHGYEALMRPCVEEFRSPLSVIEMAKQTGRMKDIEALTMFRAMDAFHREAENSDVHLFINSLSSQVLTANQFRQLTERYSSIFPRVIVEICEEESQDHDVMRTKVEMARASKMNLAIDDYGTGYNNLAIIFEYNARYLKLEGSLIRSIDSDKKKYTLAKSVIDYCRNYGILVVAESVETYAELKTVYDLGVDYVQGYLLQKPMFGLNPLPPEACAALEQLHADEKAPV